MEKINPKVAAAADRKTIEKNRRNQMKSLCSKLTSLMPRDSSGEAAFSLTDQLEEAANYIKKLQTNLETLKQKKEDLVREGNSSGRSSTSAEIGGLKLPQIEIHEVGSALEIVLVTGLDRQFMFNEIIKLLHEEDIEVVNANFSEQDNFVFHSIHAKAGESGSSRIVERIMKLVNGVSSQ